MQKVARFLGVSFAMYLVGAAAHAAPIITFGGQVDLDSGLTTAVAGATVIDFNDGLMPSSYSGAGGVVIGSVAGQYAAPAGNSTYYLSVAIGSAAGSHEINAGEYYNYFGLYWGSIDDYNTLKFFDGDNLVLTLTGTDVLDVGAAFGNQITAGSNRYVNIFLGDDYYNRIVISTTQFAFESDNHAFARVPEPGSLVLLGLSVLGAGAMRLRRA
jgi:hypothetical protein